MKAQELSSAWRRWREGVNDWKLLARLPAIPVAAVDVLTLDGPAAYRETLLRLIGEARRRILIAALYLQDDDGGREILSALHAAKQARPELDIAVFVDWHRAQRGLIGKEKSAGNAALYREMAQRLGTDVAIYGVPVQRREFLGVLHLKGFVIDDSVLYSGASLNDVYLQRHGRYRLDRYHLIHSQPLADCLAETMDRSLRQNPAVNRLDLEGPPTTLELRERIVAFRRELGLARYRFHPDRIGPGEVGITPLIGLGIRGNELNRTIVQLIRQAKRRLVLLTPYFNLPGSVRRAVDVRLRSGCQVQIIIGDKTANDFYIPPDEPFKAIGALPYLYEANLRRFCKRRQRAIDTGLLDIRLWRHDDNTFHLKGLLVDDEYALLTGNNINPRAWRLDLENGLVIQDPQGLLLAQHEAELERILAHATRLHSHAALDPLESYPLPAQRLIRRLSRVRADRLINQML